MKRRQAISQRIQSNDYNDIQQHKKYLETIKKDEPKIKNTISEINNVLEEISIRLDEADRMSDLEEKVEKNTQAEQQK